MVLWVLKLTIEFEFKDNSISFSSTIALFSSLTFDYSSSSSFNAIITLNYKNFICV